MMTTTKANGYAQTFFGAAITIICGLILYISTTNKNDMRIEIQNIKDNQSEIKYDIQQVKSRVDVIKENQVVVQTQMRQNFTDHEEIKKQLEKKK